MAVEPFAIVSLDILQDHRLTLVQTRVLIALRSFWNPRKPHDPVFPSRASLAERSGYDLRQVSKATRALCEFGWLRKEAGAGKRLSRYWIESPTLSESYPVGIVQVSNPTLSESATSTLSDSTTLTLYDSTRLYKEEQTNEQTKEQTRESKRRWRVVPADELLCDERRAFGEAQGLEPEAIQQEWNKFIDHEFAQPKQSVDRTWRNWVRRSSERSLPAIRGSTAPRRTADEKQADVFSRVREQLARPTGERSH